MVYASIQTFARHQYRLPLSWRYVSLITYTLRILINIALEVYNTPSTISDTVSANIQQNLDGVKQEVCSDMAITSCAPLCNLYDAFLDTGMFHSLQYDRYREPECSLPVILEALWEVQDTGNRETFMKMAKEVYEIYEMIAQMDRKEYLGFLGTE